MESIIEWLKTIHDEKKILKKTCKNNGVNVNFVSRFSFLKLKKMIRKISHMFLFTYLGTKAKTP